LVSILPLMSASSLTKILFAVNLPLNLKCVPSKLPAISVTPWPSILSETISEPATQVFHPFQRVLKGSYRFYQK